MSHSKTIYSNHKISLTFAKISHYNTAKNRQALTRIAETMADNTSIPDIDIALKISRITAEEKGFTWPDSVDFVEIDSFLEKFKINKAEYIQMQ